MAKNKKIEVGSVVYVNRGTRYRRFGAERKIIGREVTVRAVEPDARSGKTRIYWKSQGYKASVLI